MQVRRAGGDQMSTLQWASRLHVWTQLQPATAETMTHTACRATPAKATGARFTTMQNAVSLQPVLPPSVARTRQGLRSMLRRGAALAGQAHSSQPVRLYPQSTRSNEPRCAA